MSRDIGSEYPSGEPLPEAEVGGSYDLDEEYLVRDESGKIVMCATPEMFAKFRNNPRVAAAVEKWRRDPKNVFRVAKQITIVKQGTRTKVTDRLKAFYEQLLHIPDKEDFAARYWAEQDVRNMVTRNMQRELDTFKRRSAA